MGSAKGNLFSHALWLSIYNTQRGMCSGPYDRPKHSILLATQGEHGVQDWIKGPSLHKLGKSSAPVSGKDYSRSMQGWEVDATGNVLKNYKRHCRGCACNASIFNMYFASVLNSAVSCTRICCASRLSRIFHTCTFLNINSWHTRFFPDCLSVLVEPSTPEEAAAVLLCKWGEWGLEDDMSEIHSFQQRRDWDTTRHRKMVTVNAAWSLSCEAT